MSIVCRPSTVSLGRFGETFASEYFERCLGWRVIDRNVRTRYGEIDLIVQGPTELVFVEVKTRSSIQYGDPVATLTERQLTRILGQIQRYIATQNLPSHNFVALDVVGLLVYRHAVISLDHTRAFP